MDYRSKFPAWVCMTIYAGKSFFRSQLELKMNSRLALERADSYWMHVELFRVLDTAD